AAIYRLQTSCVGYGFFWTSNQGCGQTADGTGYNVNEAQVGSAHCALDCSGVRDADWDKHADHTPDTPQNFVCPKCSSGTGPCGRQVHCAAAPVRQAAWDLVARDLRGYQGSPFNFDANTAFIIGNKLFYQGSGNVGTWHACSCTNNTSDGCGATNGYMQWLAADDDNGNLNDGTPHMTAIYAAFNRHNIACSTPRPQNSGCSTGPTSAPSLTATPGDYQVSLSWTSVTNAAKYWVFRTEGHAGCNLGKTLIGTVTSTSFTDTEVANGRQYCYVVMAVGSSNACFGPASTCVCVTPNSSCTVPGTPTLVGPANGATGVSTTPTLDWSDVTGATSYDVQVCSDSACATVVRSQTGLTASQWTVSPALSPATTYYWRARAVNSCGAGGWSATWSFTTVSGCTPAGATYDATLRAPKCGASGLCGCDTGSLVDSRDTIAGKAELNQPNTINNSCADGTSGSYHVDESVDRIVVQTTDGTALGPGKQVRIDATVWCWGTTDYVDIYYTSNASSPVWTAVATGLQCTVSGQARTFSVTMTLANVSGLHAVRVQERYGGSASACTAGSYNDRDDLAFQVP
ncbi:MAG: endopeptidase, partial [Acidobacteria bacterium]|nr:endopeptidase [Acidobacteriota bacterium]